MDENTKAMWLKRVLVFNMIVAILIWGLPLWIGPKTILTALKITVPSDLFYMRIFGAIQLGFAYLLWLAYENPVMNRSLAISLPLVSRIRLYGSRRFLCCFLALLITC